MGDYLHLNVVSSHIVLVAKPNNEISEDHPSRVCFDLYYAPGSTPMIIPENKVGSTRMTPMPGNHGIVVSHDTVLIESWRGSNLSDAFRELKEQIARHLGYSMMLATCDTANVPACSNLLKSKYRIVETFMNKRTNNHIWLGVKKI